MKFSSLQELFEDEGRWTKGAFAKDSNGNSVSFRRDCATCFCLAGGVFVVYPPEEQQGVFVKLREAVVARGYHSEEYFNDHPSTTIDDIRRVVKEAGV